MSDDLTAREVFALEIERVWKDTEVLAQGRHPSGIPSGRPITGLERGGRELGDRVPAQFLRRLRRLSSDLRALARDAAPWVCREVVEAPAPVKHKRPMLGPLTCDRCQGPTAQVDRRGGFVVICPSCSPEET